MLRRHALAMGAAAVGLTLSRARARAEMPMFPEIADTRDVGIGERQEHLVVPGVAYGRGGIIQGRSPSRSRWASVQDAPFALAGKAPI